MLSLPPRITRIGAVAGVWFFAAGCPRPEPVPDLGPSPELRVALVTAARSVIIGGAGDVTASSVEGPVFRLAAGDTVTIAAEGESVVAPGRGAPGPYPSLTFVSLSDSRFVTFHGRPFRGRLEVLARAGGLTVVNVVGMEAYLQGVVNAEMGPRGRNDRAALQAQAVVSRTYALVNRGRFGGQGFDLQATVADQAYAGVATETEEGIEAVRSTTGEVLIYGGALISPFFHSTCGYSTASPQEAFRTVAPAPYLTPVSDRNGNGYYCDISPRFRWKVTWESERLVDILRRTLPATMGIAAERVDTVQDVQVFGKGRSGRASEVRIRVSNGEIPVFGPDVRAVFATPEGAALGSTAFQLHGERLGDRLVRLVAAGAGWGHGVGMCQWGAVGRARAGQNYRSILTTYFRGVSIARRY